MKKYICMRKYLSKRFIFYAVSSLCFMLISQNSFSLPFFNNDEESAVVENSVEEIESQDIKINQVNITESLVKNSTNIESKVAPEIKTNDAIGNILIQAISLMGISYKWGGNTPETGMDCSGFIRYVFKQSMGVNLPRTVAEMAKRGIKIGLDEMQPGDLIFFNTLHGRRNSHIGMYIGSNKFIQSPRTGEKIQISDYNSYWRSHTNGIKRIIVQNTTEDGETNITDYENITNQALPSGYIRGKHKNMKHKIWHKTRVRHSSKIKLPSVKKHRKHKR
jgi:cell wall-associated NlpC family hydrolase